MEWGWTARGGGRGVVANEGVRVGVGKPEPNVKSTPRFEEKLVRVGVGIELVESSRNGALC